MALEGRLSEFTLEEILQLIALQQKTGVLTVESSYAMVLYFENGELVSYRDRRGSAPDPLRRYLRSYGFFTSENWEHLDFIQRNTDLDFTEVLVNEGHLSPEELIRVQHDAVQEHIYRGMLLRDGRYHFNAGRESVRGLKGRVRLKVEGLLMEAARRIDEIASFEERYPDGTVKIRRTDQEPGEAPLSAGMRHVLAVLGEENSLERLEAQGRMSHFDLLQTLEMLRDLGLIEVLDLPAPAPVEEKASASSSPAASSATVLPAVLLALAALALIAGTWALRPLRGYAHSSGGAADRAVAFHRARDEARIHAALQLHHRAHGRWPQTLKTLLQPELLGEDFDLSGWDYRRQGASYDLGRD